MHVIALRGISSHIDLKCVYKKNGLELLTPIASNKNG
jgi:hypothetical protein